MAILGTIIYLYVVVIFARIILSYFPIGFDSPLVPVVRFLNAVTEPVLGPIRRVLPPVRMGGMALDLSPTIVMIVLLVVASRLR